MFSRFFKSKELKKDTVSLEYPDVNAKSFGRILNMELSNKASRDFRNCKEFTVELSRDWLGNAKTGTPVIVNGRVFKVKNIYDPYPNQEEWGRHYTVKVTFEVS